ncbi:hypothetical protein niasHT_026029 [Heterodera trifolii]|uniref:Helitron helicase-like domain-containing protein n=1 Tax=Heterodera trifolii TaxID=157864 RepID=A0ABD2KIX2_9BILA
MDLRVSTPKNLLQYLVNQYNKQQARQNPNAQQRTVDDIGSVVRFNDNNVNCLQYWKKMYENCNTIFARCHNPKKARLFITFTNNREWPEFKANLYNNGQVFTDRFDMWMRVWISKIAEFREELYEKKFFGTILGSGESMEFQGRGGPHAHIVAQTDLDAVPDVIQQYIWAHIPLLPEACLAAKSCTWSTGLGNPFCSDRNIGHEYHTNFRCICAAANAAIRALGVGSVSTSAYPLFAIPFCHLVVFGESRGLPPSKIPSPPPLPCRRGKFAPQSPQPIAFIHSQSHSHWNWIRISTRVLVMEELSD